MIFFSIKSVHPSSVLFSVLFVPMHISIQRHTGAQLEEFRFWRADRKGSSRGNMFHGPGPFYETSSNLYSKCTYNRKKCWPSYLPYFLKQAQLIFWLSLGELSVLLTVYRLKYKPPGAPHQDPITIKFASGLELNCSKYSVSNCLKYDQQNEKLTSKPNENIGYLPLERNVHVISKWSPVY